MATPASGNLIALVAAIIAIGVVAQVLSDRFQIPSVVFLIGAGIVLGPEVTGILDPTTFQGALSAIVGLSVAIIVFEGAFHIRLNALRQAPAATLRLVTVGALIALVGTTLAVRYALGAPWNISVLVGALLVATGPTVITPILSVVPVRDRVATALETEGIVNDVTAAILAVVVFEATITGTSDPAELLELFAGRLGVGLLVGAIVAGALFYLVRYVDLSPGNAPQNARLLVLAGALVAYGAADAVLTEAGVAAAATAGLILGNLNIPYEEDITEFKGDITLLVLSFVFIALAALLRFEDLLSLGVGGVVVVVAVALLVRPALVFLSTVGGRFTTPEKLFMSFVGPRGIIPASVATLFAVEFRNRADTLREAGEVARAAQFDAGATVLVGTVFLVILVTVVVEGGFARHIAEYLNVIPMRVLVIGGGKVGRELATRLENRGENVVIVENDETVVETARNRGHAVHIGDGTDTEVLRAAGAENARIVVAVTGDDDSNLLVAQLADSKFDPDTIIARVNNPDNVDAFEELGVRAISSTIATAWALDNAIERPALSAWMTEMGEGGDVQEIEVTAEDLVGRTIAELDTDLPNGCIIALVSRDGESQVPEEGFTLQYGDHITFLGRDDAVRDAINLCNPRD
jgi:NhaP-type Na+/H+ or K+/H+ antiporter